jgi:hypothetical protein
MQGAGAVDHQYSACARLRDHRFQQRIVLKAAHGADGAGEFRAAPELAKLKIAAANVGPDAVDEIGGWPE